VQIAVTAKSTKPGTLKIYPAGNPTGGSPQSVLFAANALAAATVAQNVGLKSAVTFENTGLAAVTVTAKLIGYSTQVTAGDIAPTGGVAGQVLTNTGPEAVWQTPNFQSTDTSTITVHPGSSGTANGTKLLAAVAAITPGAPTLVRLEAGTYDLGGATLALPSNSWVEGAGQGLTTVAGSAPNLVSTTTGNSGLELLTLSGAGSACVNIPSTGSVTVQLVSITGCARGISITGAATLSVVDSTINATNGRAIDASAGNIAVSGSTLADTGGIGSGIAIGGASVLKVSASSISGAVIGLLQSSPAISTVTGSQLIGNSAALNNGGQASVADSLLVGGVSNIGTLRCVGAYNASYVTLSSTCT
jgi:hypothetical protein